MEAQPHFLLRVYTDEAAMVGDRRGFDFVLDRAREAGLLGATVQRAPPASAMARICTGAGLSITISRSSSR